MRAAQAVRVHPPIDKDHRMRKLLVPVALTAVLSGGAGALVFGPALAGAADTTTTAPPAATAEAAPTVKDRPQPFKDALDKLVADGTITQAQADKVAAALEAARPAKGLGGPGGPGMRHGFAEVALDEVASILGLQATDLKTQLQAGKSLADIAGDKKDELITGLVDKADAKIDAAVTDGKLTADQATKLKAGLKDRITHVVEDGPKLGRAFGGGRGPRPAPGQAD
jgi:polyhydroxyalkanoate synthesis regulator phasin